MEELLAKSTGETLLEHTRLCIKAAQSIVDGLPFPLHVRDEILRDLMPAVVLHDSGKAATGFQAMLRQETPNWRGRRHEVLSAAVASQIAAIPEASILAVLTHHRTLPPDVTYVRSDCLPSEQLPIGRQRPQAWIAMKEEWTLNESAATAFLRAAWSDAKLETLLEACSPADELRLDPNWLRRGPSGQKAHLSDVARRYASLLRGLLISADHLASAHATPSPIPRFAAYQLRSDHRPFQEEAAETVGSAILRAPTGSGKTDAAFAWMARNQRPNGRLFYVLPYTASIDAMHARLRAAFGAAHVGLLHSRATASLYKTLEDGDDASSRLDRQDNAVLLRGLAKEIWFPIRVCTPHQLLRWLLRGRGWEIMLAEFPSACFVFDEVHAYEPRIVGLLLASIRLLHKWNARFLFVSATIPAFLSKLFELAVPELIPLAPREDRARDREILHRKRHLLEICAGDMLSNLELIRVTIRSPGTTLLVCNHVETAQSLCRILRTEFGDDVVLLHSRFNREDRIEIESRLLKALPRVLVATQVIEVSLDIDFDRAFLEPAPIDALIQRMGRTNRNRGADAPPASVTVFSDQVSPWNIYCDCGGQSHSTSCIVLLSLQELRSLPNPMEENDLANAADRVYGCGYTGSAACEFDEGNTHPELSAFETSIVAGVHRDWVDDVMKASAATIDVLPRSRQREYDRRLKCGLWVEADMLLVPVRSTTLRAHGIRVERDGEVSVVDCLYSSKNGLEV